MKQSSKKLPGNKKASPNPLINKEGIEHNPEKKIKDDFPGYPHEPSQQETINPKSKEKKFIADANIKDGEKRGKHSDNQDEQQSDASGTAFERTEMVRE
jgi:hypothetical protein